MRTRKSLETSGLSSAQFYGLLSNRTRLRIAIYLTKEDGADVASIREMLCGDSSTVHYHLSHGRVAGIWTQSRIGRRSVYSLTDLGRAAVERVERLIAEAE